LAEKRDKLLVGNGGAAGLTVGERVEALAWERLRGNVEGGVVGRWQEVSQSLNYLIFPSMPTY
jgi:hypothetical protein